MLQSLMEKCVSSLPLADMQEKDLTDARLDTLFLIMPVSWKGTIVQYAGRIHRLHEGKKDVRYTTMWTAMCLC